MIVREIVAQGLEDGDTLSHALAEAAGEIEFNRLDVAVAYATKPGLNALRDAIGGWPLETRWVVGLDDAITQPTAIDDILALENVELRLAALAKQGRRFHPKYYCLWSSHDPSCCLVALGSANMTLHGLNKNGEVGVLLQSESIAEADTLKGVWQSMAGLGAPHDEVDLQGYRQFHERAKKARKKIAKSGVIPLDPELAEEEGDVPVFNGEPAYATVAWTEGASPPAGGRDLEFPRLMMPFFHLTKSPVTKRFRMADGSTHLLTFTMRNDNQMWRLMFSSDSIRAGTGRENMRPVGGGTNRSDLAIVFTRAEKGADYDVSFIVIGSDEHEELLAKTKIVGVLNRTRDPGGRHFGYY